MVIELRHIDAAAEPAAIDDMHDVIARAFGSNFRNQIDWYIAAQPDGIVVATDAGAIVGAGMCIAYPEAGFGWIGLIATDPGNERRGIGRLVTDRLSDVLESHGCASVLDASSSGGPLYARMGFTDCGLTRGLLAPSASTTPVAATSDVAPIVARDLDDVIAYDTAIFGASRRTLLETLHAQHPGRGGVVRAVDGTVTGYVIAQGASIGPLVADGAAEMSALAAFACALPWSDRARVCVPPESVHLQTLLAAGFTPFRDWRHMHRGIDALPGRPQLSAGRISLGVG